MKLVKHLVSWDEFDKSLKKFGESIKFIIRNEQYQSHTGYSDMFIFVVDESEPEKKGRRKINATRPHAE